MNLKGLRLNESLLRHVLSMERTFVATCKDWFEVIVEPRFLLPRLPPFRIASISVLIVDT